MGFNVKDKRFAKEENIESNFKLKIDVANIKVKIRNAPTMSDLRSYMPDFLMSTWAQSTDEFKNIDKETADKFIYRMFQQKFLPTAMETINMVVTFEGITWHDVTHLLRYRSMSFAGDCSGDKYLNERTIVIPEAIIEAGKQDDYVKLMHDSMNMYVDLVNNGNVSIQDARLVLPRTMTTFYHVRMNLTDALRFIMHRSDRQIQPKSDNIMAYQLAVEICKRYPLLSTIINIDGQNKFYVHESQTNFYSGFFKPYPENDVFNYDDDTFLFNKTREELYGNGFFNVLKAGYLQELAEIKEQALIDYKHVFEDLDDWR